MHLLLRVAPDARRPERVDVVATVEPGHTVGDLASALGHHLGVAVPATLVRLRDGAPLGVDRTLGDAAVASGDVLAFDAGTAFGGAGHRNLDRAVVLAVEGGPSQGWSAPLVPGAYRVGSRGAGADPATLVVDDPTLGPQQLSVVVDPELRVTVDEVADAANPLTVNGVRPTLPVVLAPGDVVRVGDSSFQVLGVVRPAEHEIDQLGQVALHRAPFRPSRPVQVELASVGPIPAELDVPRFSKVGAIMPLAGAAGMAAILQNPTFLWFAAMAPVTGFASNFDQRRRARERHARELERFRSRLADRSSRLRDAVAAERDARRLASPGLAELGQRAEFRTEDLWCRGRDIAEFLTLRVGKGAVDTMVTMPDDGGGDDLYRDEVAAVNAPYESIPDVPITVALAELGAVGLQGRSADVESLASAMVLQAACLHSPEDLVVAGSVTADSHIADWLKWLPHTRATGSPLSGAHLAIGKPATDALLRSVLEVAEFRVGSRERDVDRRWPWVLLVLDRRQDPDPALVAQLLAHCPEAGISVLWLTDRADRLPPQCRAVAELADRRHHGDGASRLWFTDPDVEGLTFDADGVDPQVPDKVGLALAPLRDASSGTLTSSIPRLVPLFAAHQVDHITPGWVEASWAVDRGYSLTTVLGLSADGPLVLDLVEHGPHGLIGGTSGSGKSELLQSLVAGLVAAHGPDELNLLFIDFKGGSASDVFRDLPHVAGRVTDLDESLALRAQVSLRAELRRRARLFEGRAKDIAEMRDRFRAEAPPSLVIVIDEFATLVKTLPNFVNELVDIAQRGRSYGIHLLLATQRPSAAVDDNIRANTNLRISLRMIDSAESNSVLDSPDAAQIPVPLKGRALARLGPGELVEFQSAFCGAPLPSTAGPPPIVIEPFDPRVGRGPSRTTSAADVVDAPTQLGALIDSVLALGRPRTRQVWNEVLPEVLTLDRAVALGAAPAPGGSGPADLEPAAAGPTGDDHPSVVASPGRSVLIGAADDPEHQAQYGTSVDLEAGGGLLVFGAAGSGKTEVLRTVAASAARDDRAAGGGRLVVFVLDFTGSGARSIGELPQCAGVGGIDDLEATTRILATLATEITRRRSVDPATLDGAEHPRLLLLVDGYANLVDVLTNTRASQETATDEWLALFHRIVLDGRRTGIHTVITADRGASVRTAILAGVTTRLVLRQADDAEARDLGVPATSSFGPGAGYLAGLRVQVAITTPTAEAEAEADAVADPSAGAVAATGEAVGADRFVAARIDACTDRYRGASLDHLPAADPAPGPDGPQRLRGTIGIADITLAPVGFDLTSADLLVTGPPRSGRSTALLAVATQLRAAGHEVFVIGPEDSRLTAVPWPRAAFDTAAIEPLLGELKAHLSFPGADAVLVVDDLDLVEGGAFESGVAGYEHNRSLRIVASTTGFPYPANDVRKRIRSARQVLYLQPGSSRDVAEVVGVVRLPPLRLGLAFPPGRGLFVANRVPTAVQVMDPTVTSTADEIWSAGHG